MWITEMSSIYLRHAITASRHTRHMRLGRLIVAMATLIALAACAPYEEPELGPIASEPNTPNLYVSLERPRYLVTRRMVELILRNDGDEPVTVDTLQLVSGAFTPVKRTVRDVELEPG